MKKTVIIYGHPYYKMSVCNKAILEELEKEVPEVDIVNLMELYPDFNIDVNKEQSRVKDADVIVFQFPFWWYGSPSIMHRYVEDVFSHGFAFGSTGTALHGKKIIFSFTIGASEDAYSKDGFQHYDINAFMPGFRNMASLCGLEFLDPIYSFGMMVVDPNDTTHNDAVLAKASKHGKRLANAIKAQ